MDLILSTAEKLNTLNVKSFIDGIAAQYYSDIFSKLNHIQQTIENIDDKLDMSLMRPVHTIMEEQADEIFRKEKLVLYPFLLQLEAEGKKSPSCKPFKSVKYHFTYLISTIQQFKTLLRQLRADVLVFGVELDMLNSEIALLEKQLIEFQNIKERHLFNRFKDCNSQGCKADLL